MPHSMMYVSRSLLVLPRDHQQIAAIQLYSVARNRDLDLTGVMIASPLHFAQYLEGDAESLALVMASIRRDRRHTDLVIWQPPQLERRRFPNWRMTLFGPDESINHAISPILAHLNGTLPDLQKAEMIGLMQELADTRAHLPDDR